MLESLIARVDRAPRFASYGRTTRVIGLVIEAVGLGPAVGELCRISRRGEHSA